MKKERKEKESNEIDKQILSKALADLFSAYDEEYGKIKKFKRDGNLIIEAITGGWSGNEEAIRKFNSTKFGSVTIKWWFLTKWERGGYFRWEIPLFYIEGVNENGRRKKR